MKPYWVEGLFVTKKGVKSARRTGQYAGKDIEPFAETIWANHPDEALQLAYEKLEGGEWFEEPEVSLVSEEKRMRAMGAPELPGLAPVAHSKKNRR